jgi:lysozyme family protein
MSEHSRRQILAASIGVSASALLATQASAQSADMILKALTQLTGGKEAAPGGGARKTIDVVKVIAMVLMLEKKIDLSTLPSTPLSLQPATDRQNVIPSDLDSLYSATMPRLVNAMDRTGDAEPGMSDDAAEVLADLNESERTAPEALSGKPSRARDFMSLKPEYAALFSAIEVRNERADLARWNAAAIQQFRSRYENVARATGVPWFFIGLVHGLEASYNFRAHLHNGDFPLGQRTRQVPAGRPRQWGPPSDWESSAVDALRLMQFAGARDWTLERTLYRLEAYNGFGYRRLGVPTPYLWSFSNHYEGGKFVADGSFSPRARSQQCGAAVTLKLLTKAGAVDWA